jgi:hypothetical protein
MIRNTAGRRLWIGVAAAPCCAGQANSGREYERRAIALVNTWVSALLAKDAEKAASYLDENIQYRDDPFQTALKQGRAQALTDIKTLLRGLTGMKIETAYAVGRKEVLVLRDAWTFAWKARSIRAPAGLFRVVAAVLTAGHRWSNHTSAEDLKEIPMLQILDSFWPQHWAPPRLRSRRRAQRLDRSQRPDAAL